MEEKEKESKAVIQIGEDSIDVPLKEKHFEKSGKDGFHGVRMIGINKKVYRCQVMLFEQ